MSPRICYLNDFKQNMTLIQIFKKRGKFYLINIFMLYLYFLKEVTNSPFATVVIDICKLYAWHNIWHFPENVVVQRPLLCQLCWCCFSRVQKLSEGDTCNTGIHKEMKFINIVKYKNRDYNALKFCVGLWNIQITFSSYLSVRWNMISFF